MSKFKLCKRCIINLTNPKEQYQRAVKYNTKTYKTIDKDKRKSCPLCIINEESNRAIKYKDEKGYKLATMGINSKMAIEDIINLVMKGMTKKDIRLFS